MPVLFLHISRQTAFAFGSIWNAPLRPHTECDTVGADSISARGILRSRQMPRNIAASRRGEHCSPEGFCAAAHCHGRTMFAPTAHIWLCVGAAKRRRPGNYAHLTGGYRIRPYAWGFCPPLRDWRYKATVDTVDTVGHSQRPCSFAGAACLSSPTAARSDLLPCYISYSQFLYYQRLQLNQRLFLAS